MRVHAVEDASPVLPACAPLQDAGARAAPVTIPCGEEWCAGWFHAPGRAARDLAVVVCPPIGIEAVSGYGIVVQLATHLAAQGLPVLRFDYHGTGESAGGDADARRVDAWLASIEAATAQARLLSGARHVALLGIRLGALLALKAARTAHTDCMVLWAPCPSGRSFVRELRMGGSSEQDGSLRTQGYWYSAETLRDLGALDPFKAPWTAPRRVLLIGRDDLSLEQPLATALGQAGADVEFTVLPGYSAMLQNGRFAGRVDDRLLAPLAAWLLRSPLAVPLRRARPPTPAAASRTAGGVRETPVWFGAGARLCGVLSEPQATPPTPGARAVVLLNAGHAYRIGPHRLYVQLARTLAAGGHRVLRMDLAGVGDSLQAGPREPLAELYSLESLRDVRAAVDWFAATGAHGVVLAGLCSGAYLAFQASLRDARIAGVVLMNPRLLEWSRQAPGDSWESTRELYPKPARAYGRALLRASVWRRLVTGQVSLGWIVQAFASLAAARLRGCLRTRALADGSPLGSMRRLCSRGTPVLLLASDDAESHQYVQFHFGAAGKLLRSQPLFTWAGVADADHTFTRRGNVETVAERMLDSLRERDETPSP